MSSSREKLLGNTPVGRVYVISAPAGTGKTTLVNRLLAEFPVIERSVTSTTRSPRPDECDGVDYHFLTKDDFAQKSAAGEWLESVTLYGHSYGSSSKHIASRVEQGKIVLLVIDTQGMKHVREKLDVTTIMIVPPSLEELQRRLAHRETESQQEQEKRLAWAKDELGRQNEYDYVVVNDDLDIAYEVLRSIFIAEERKRRL